MRKSKQNNGVNLFQEQTREDDRRLATSFVGMAGALRSRPEPRAKWDNVAADRAHYKGRDAVLSAQEVIAAAIATGETGVIEETAARVATHFDRMKDAGMRRYYALVNGAASLPVKMAAASKEATEAVDAIVQRALGRVNDDDAIREIDEGIRALSEMRASLVAQRAPLNRPRPVALMS